MKGGKVAAKGIYGRVCIRPGIKASRKSIVREWA